MKLEAYLVRDGAGMEHVQSQLTTLRIYLSKITKEKEKHEHVWRITCMTKCHR